MTEDQARQIVLLQVLEGTAAAAHWRADDAAWATQQALAAVGEGGRPERFVAARAAAALSRLLPRDAASQRWLDRRLWHPAWVLMAALLGAGLGLFVDQLGAPQQVNLLAPAVWAVVGWNLAVYAALLWPRTSSGLRGALASMVLMWRSGRPTGATAAWAQHAAPLAMRRLTLLMHVAAAALACGLVAGLYLRGLVLDYRIGWQSTFAGPEAVQSALRLLLAPASALTGIALPDVGPLRLAPGEAARASAAPWIHLFAATLLLWVVLPRLAMAAMAGVRAWHGARHFALALDTPYFEALHPLMRPGPPRVLRLLWVPAAETPRLRLLDADLGALDAPLTLARSEQGDELQLLSLPSALRPGAPPAPACPWWRRWWPPADEASRLLPALARQIDAVVLCTKPGAAPPAWLAALGRPVLTLHDAPRADAPALALAALDDGWLRQGRLWPALQVLLPGDARLKRVADAWRASERLRLSGAMQVLADALGRIAVARVELATDAAADAEATARAALTQSLEAELRDTGRRLAVMLGRADDTALPASVGRDAATLHARLPEARAALVGGAAAGAITGLKADLLSGGLTMGAGALTGLVLGALGSAGVARGINAARGTERSHVSWSDAVLDDLAWQMLRAYRAWAYSSTADSAQTHRSPAGASTLADVWRSRDERLARTQAAAEATRLASALQPRLEGWLRQALGGP